MVSKRWIWVLDIFLAGRSNILVLPRKILSTRDRTFHDGLFFQDRAGKTCTFRMYLHHKCGRYIFHPNTVYRVYVQAAQRKHRKPGQPSGVIYHYLYTIFFSPTKLITSLKPMTGHRSSSNHCKRTRIYIYTCVCTRKHIIIGLSSQNPSKGCVHSRTVNPAVPHRRNPSAYPYGVFSTTNPIWLANAYTCTLCIHRVHTNTYIQIHTHIRAKTKTKTPNPFSVVTECTTPLQSLFLCALRNLTGKKMRKKCWQFPWRLNTDLIGGGE